MERRDAGQVGEDLCGGGGEHAAPGSASISSVQFDLHRLPKLYSVHCSDGVKNLGQHEKFR